MSETIPISEIFRSIQGESTLAGRPCAFVRTAGCNLRCSYCDTRYAAEGEGRPMGLGQICGRVQELGCALVCLTGGEPLLHPALPRLAQRLLGEGHQVLVETNGSREVGALPPGARVIMDVKCPGSGECGSLLEGNLEALGEEDEVKFVLCDRRDFDWALEFARRGGLPGRRTVLFSPAHGRLEGRVLAEWILESKAPVRLQLQLQKILWPERRRGV